MNKSTTIYAATGDGRVVALADTGSSVVCTACFSAVANDESLASASFESSPTLTTHPIVGNVTAVFIGATVRRHGAAIDTGKIYALNSGGTLQWEFPSRLTGGSEIGPVTSSPALGPGNNVYATTADGSLLALTSGGLEIWRYQLAIPGTTTVPPLLAPSAVTTSSRVFAASAEGRIVGLTLSGQFTWEYEADDEIATSLAFGFQAVSTPTPTSPNEVPPTPTPPTALTATPTRTPTSGTFPSTLYGISKRGDLVVLDATLGNPVPPSGPLPTPVTGEVESSPAVSFDNYLVFGTNAGLLYVVDSATGLPPSGFPLQLTEGAAIRSSPSIGGNGTIYVGADDGMLYAVGAP
jgi:outer membrane protein assembly factor BamB